MATYYFGEVLGQPVGSEYANRTAAKEAGVHQVIQQGISGNGTVGTNSIVVNGGYEDDQDFGDEIFYTGAGKNDPRTKHQLADQELSQHGNAGLVVSEQNALPVRVIRGSQGEAAYSPTSGFRYDGLFRVAEHSSKIGKSGFRIWRFRLVRLSTEEAAPFVPSGNLPAGTPAPAQVSGVVQRIVRDTKVSNAIKKLYNYTCQICDERLDLPVGNYAEGAHIRGLGKPHDGPDQPTNLLCLCPNHHVLFDKGAIYVDSDLSVRDHRGGFLSSLTVDPTHDVDLAQLEYHRTTFDLPFAEGPTKALGAKP